MISLTGLFGIISLTVVLSILSGCATTPDTGPQSTGFSVQKLEIASPVSTTSAYKATMYCRGLDTVDILMGYFFWDNEGPFEYGIAKIELQKGEIIFNLRTRNPGTYRINGYVSYRDKSTGKSRRSNTVSAGSVTAR